MATLTGEVDDEPDTSGSSYSNDFSDGTMGVNELDGNGWWWSSTICPGRTIVLEQSFFKVVRASMISSPCTFNLAYPPPKHLICWRKAWRIRDETMVFFVRTTLIQLGWEDKEYEKKRRYVSTSHVDIERFCNFTTLTCLHHVSINYVRSYLESKAFNIAANAILDGRTLWHNSELYTANSSWYLATSNTLHPLPTLLSLWVGG